MIHILNVFKKPLRFNLNFLNYIWNENKNKKIISNRSFQSKDSSIFRKSILSVLRFNGYEFERISPLRQT